MTRYHVVAGADLVAGQWCARFGDRTEDPIGGLTVADLEEDLAAGVDFALYDWEHFDPAMHRRSVVAFIIVGDAPAPDAACPCDSCAARDWDVP